jgi:hypothetical protein
LAGNLEKPLVSLYGTEWRSVAIDCGMEKILQQLVPIRKTISISVP